MRLIWPIIKDTAIYFWEELFFLVLFNILTVLSIAPGVAIGISLLNVAIEDYRQLAEPRPSILPYLFFPYITIVILWSLVPYTLFGFFWTVYEISEGKAIRWSIFFVGGKKFLKQAYIWWGINIGVVTILLVNIIFYYQWTPNWRIFSAMFFVGLFLTWLLAQLFALTMYPRLIVPGFKLATLNALAIIAKYPIPIFLVGLLILAFIIIGIIVVPVRWFIIAALIATLLNMTTRKILQATLASPEAETDSANG